MQVIEEAPKLMCGDEAIRAVNQIGVALFNRVIEVGDLVVYRRDDGIKQAGAKLTRAAWLNADGQPLCQIEGIPEPVPCCRVTLLTSVLKSSKRPKPDKPQPKGSLFDTRH